MPGLAGDDGLLATAAQDQVVACIRDFLNAISLLTKYRNQPVDERAVFEFTQQIQIALGFYQTLPFFAMKQGKR